MAINYIEGVISPHIDRQLGIDGRVGVEPLKDGMSGSSVLKIISGDKYPFVVKHNPTARHKIQREIDAYNKLAQTPLADRVLIPHCYFFDEGVLAIPYFPGVSLRKGLQEGVIAPDTAVKVHRELIKLKQDWWSSQEKLTGDDYLSMQRNEWPETKELVDYSADRIAKKFGIATKAITDRPFMINGVVHPPLKETVEIAGQLLERPPERLGWAHNDASGANILIDPESENWVITDHEWFGKNDRAEAASRFVKQESTTTAHTIDANATYDGKTVEFALKADFHPLTKEMQRIGLRSIEVFEERLKDPDFGNRFDIYLSGSHLRELALAPRRANEHAAVLALYNASINPRLLLN